MLTPFTHENLVVNSLAFVYGQKSCLQYWSQDALVDRVVDVASEQVDEEELPEVEPEDVLIEALRFAGVGQLFYVQVV